MSIEPEVPLQYQEGYESDHWRDLNLNYDPRSAVARDATLIDVAPLSATPSNDTNSPSRTAHAYKETTLTPDTISRDPDDHWVLPTYVSPKDVLGSRESRTNEIQRATGAFIWLNKEYNQVDIWGDVDAIAKTKSYLDMIVSRLAENDTSLQRKTKKWGKPERELTEKERRRAERKQARMEEERRYQGLPPVPQNYNAVFPLPNKNLPLIQFTGENESKFNAIRVSCKAFIWYEAQGNLIRIGAESEEAVKQAATRVRNCYLRSCRREIGSTLRLMQQPNRRYKLNYRKLPEGFVTYEYVKPEREKMMLEDQRMFEPVAGGVAIGVRNLIALDETQINSSSNEEPLSDHLKTLNQRNEKQVEQCLVNGLESIRLNDWVIRMKIRFGQICLVDYPNKKTEFFTLEDVSDKLFRKKKFRSALAPCISKSFQGLASLFDFLASDPDAVEFSNNPRTSFSIAAQQYPTAAPPSVPGHRNPPRGDMWDTVLHVSFTEKGERRLWSTITECKDLVDISTTDLESQYSWDMKLQCARRLPSEDIQAPHEKFSSSLRVSSENRLIMFTSNDYLPKLVTQKTKWLYSWKGYVIEVCHDEVWDIDRVHRIDLALPVDLSHIDPHRSLYKVSLYKESWVNRFAENLDLDIGEAPNWTLQDFLASPDENTHTIMQTAKEFSNILDSKVPVYWDATVNSFI